MKKLNTLWADITDARWNNWRWQMKNRVTTVDQLRQVVGLSMQKRRK